MRRIWVVPTVVGLGMAVSLPQAGAGDHRVRTENQPQPHVCAGVTCSEHGTCFPERAVPMCQCHDGYAASGTRCLPVREASFAWTNRRTAWARQRVVDVAIAQVGRGPREVGAGLVAYPGPLHRWVDRGELWCTDFVSWVFAVAGVPFTGGYAGGWHVGNNAALKEWFKRHDAWVPSGTDAWRASEPQPGDYLRVHTQSGAGHSAIVHRLDGDTLYTIEGNVGNVVRLSRYRNYRNDRRIDGIGRLVPPADAKPPTDGQENRDSP